MPHTPRPLCGLIFLMLSASFFGCKPEPIAPQSSVSVTKADREILGNRLLDLIKDAPLDYPILANAGQDTLVYQFVQTLYNQATAIIRLDQNSPVENRWNSDRKWMIHILDRDESLDAFTLPGGDLFITTGFLKSMEREHELFYLLSFEANLINEKYLLSRMVSEYNTVNLKNIINGAIESNGISINEVMKDAIEFIFSSDEVGQIDAATVPELCNTSVYRADGIMQISERTTTISNYWLVRRMNYSGRGERALALANAAGNCGTLRTNGAYQEYVLDILD